MGEKDKKNFFDVLDKNLQDMGTRVSVILEMLVAILVFFACVIGIMHLFPAAKELFLAGGSSQALNDFLEEVFAVVIGIEFLKMLCKPNSANVLETIIFLVARHMIIASATPLENLFSVLAIVALILAKRYLSMMLKKEAQEQKKE